MSRAKYNQTRYEKTIAEEDNRVSNENLERN